MLHLINHGIYSAALFLLVGIIYVASYADVRRVADVGRVWADCRCMPGYSGGHFWQIGLTAPPPPMGCAADLSVLISEVS